MAHSVLIVMGSDSDFDQTAAAWKVLESLGVGYEVDGRLGAPLAGAGRRASRGARGRRGSA